MSQKSGGELVDDNAIYVGAENMAYFRVDSPDMLDFVLKYHSKNESSTTIIVRAISRASPNTSPLRNSAAARLADSPGTPPQFNVVDPLTLERVEDLVAKETVRLRAERVQITVDASNLVQFLRHAENDGKSIFRLSLAASDQHSEDITIDFAQHELWFRCLCRGNDEAQRFRQIFMHGVKSMEIHKESLSTLKGTRSDVWYKLLCFARDLERGPDQPQVGQRFNAIELDPDQCFLISELHFGNDVSYILNFPGQTGRCLQEVLQHTVENAQGPICTAHTLFPLITRFFGIDRTTFHDRRFKDEYSAFEKEWKKRAKKSGRR
ncbi:unnamed protein product [Somion occarium]|uniref:Uncharacterized protein n=1 Tax=Somion occarium TaxID=3059160 RepID=A0ABP1DRB3_9APHY